MTLQLIKKDGYHINFSCNEDATSNALLMDIQKAFYEYLNEFSLEINNEFGITLQWSSGLILDN